MIPVKVLAVRYLNNVSASLAESLGAPSLGLLTTDCDDATYIALDAATKAADVRVVYAKSFYAGAANASTPNAGEVLGVLAGPTPGAVRSGMEAALFLLERVGFEEVNGVPYLAPYTRGAQFAGGGPDLVRPPLSAMKWRRGAVRTQNRRNQR